MSPDSLASLKGRVGQREVLACKSCHFGDVDLLVRRKLYAMHAHAAVESCLCVGDDAHALKALGAWLRKI